MWGQKLRYVVGLAVATMGGCLPSWSETGPVDDGAATEGPSTSPTAGAPAEDPDEDGLSTEQEAVLGTDPGDDDTDDDGLTDGLEATVYLTDPLDVDTDSDALPDGLEVGLDAPVGRDTDLSVFVADADPLGVSDPLDPDTDGDFLFDGVEDVNRNGAWDGDVAGTASDESDPLVPDTDGDGVTDGAESLGTDADLDGTIDALDAIDDLDCDGQASLLGGVSPSHQTQDLYTEPYTFGAVISPVLLYDQVIFQLTGPLPANPIRLCVDWEVLGTGSGMAESFVQRDMDPWDHRIRVTHPIGPGRRLECFDETTPYAIPFTLTGVGALRFWAAGAVEAYIVHGVELCEAP